MAFFLYKAESFGTHTSVANVQVLFAKVWKTVNLCNLFWHKVMCAHRPPSCVRRKWERGERREGWGAGPRKVRRRQSTGEPAGCRGFEPNRWWRLGDVPSPGLSAVIEDNLSTQRESACPLSGGEVNMKKILHYHWLCVAGHALSPVSDLILASGRGGEEELSPWLGVQRHAHEYVSGLTPLSAPLLTRVLPALITHWHPGGGQVWGNLGRRSDSTPFVEGQKSEGKRLVLPAVSMHLSAWHKVPGTHSRLRLNNVHNRILMKGGALSHGALCRFEHFPGCFGINRLSSSTNFKSNKKYA